MVTAAHPSPSHRRVRLALRVIQRVLVVLVVVLALLALALAILLRPNAQGIDELFGHPVFSVASGSMTPAIETGDLIVDNSVTSPQPANLHLGQIISFQESASSATSLIITHRIVAVLPGTASAPVLYRTKGDANNAPDLGTVAPSQVLGVYTTRVPFGAYVISTLHQPITFVVLIMIPVVYLVEEEVRRRWIALGLQEAERKEAKRKQAEVDGQTEVSLPT
jgi:signal peptidase